jgi:hypothetical protein
MGRWGRSVGALKGRGAIGLGAVAFEDGSEGRRSDGGRVWNRGGSSMMDCLVRSRGWSIDIRRCGARRTESSLSIEVLRIADIRLGGYSRISGTAGCDAVDSVASIANSGWRGSKDNRRTASVSCNGIIFSESRVAGGIILGLGSKVGGVYDSSVETLGRLYLNGIDGSGNDSQVGTELFILDSSSRVRIREFKDP